MRYHEIDPTYLGEAFDSSVDARWTQQAHSQWTAEFQLHDQRFGVYFENLGRGWVVSYGVVQNGEDASSWTSNYSPTGQSGTAGIKVLSTVVNLVKQFLAKKSPDSLKFTGDKAEGLGPLYTRMVKILQGQLTSAGYRVDQTDDTRNGEMVFQFVKLQSQNSIEEAFDSSLPIAWTHQKPTFWTAQFKQYDVRYVIDFVKSGKSWNFSYQYAADGGKFDASPSGLSGPGAVKIISTVIAACKHFLTQVKPEELSFQGSHENGLYKMYEAILRFMKTKISQFGYTVEYEDDGYSDSFSVVRQAVDEHYDNIRETSTAGATGSGSVATVVGGLGGGFDPNGDHGIYQKARKKSKKPAVIRR